MSGSVPIVILAPALAIGFAIRFFGNSLHLARGKWGMPWGARVPSWLLFGAAALLMWTAGSLLSIAAFAGFVVLDAAGGLVKRDEEARPERRKRDWRPFWMGTGILLYLGLTAAFYLLVGRYFVYGVLVTWTILAFGFALLLRLSLVGEKAGEAWLRAPEDHRRHERVEQAVVDPQRERAERALVALRARGDAAPFLDLVREAARGADLPDAEAQALEQRLVHSFSRAGTRRDADLFAALDEVERALALRGPGRAIPLDRKETPP